MEFDSLAPEMLCEICKDAAKVFIKATWHTLQYFISKDNNITKEESLKILNITSDNPQQVNQAFNILYKKNSSKNCGSPYILSKISNAYKYLQSKK